MTHAAQNETMGEQWKNILVNLSPGTITLLSSFIIVILVLFSVILGLIIHIYAHQRHTRNIQIDIQKMCLHLLDANLQWKTKFDTLLATQLEKSDDNDDDDARLANTHPFENNSTL